MFIFCNYYWYFVVIKFLFFIFNVSEKSLIVDKNTFDMCFISFLFSIAQDVGFAFAHSPSKNSSKKTISDAIPKLRESLKKEVME